MENNSVGLVTKVAKKSDFPLKAKALFGLNKDKKKGAKK